jgi:aminoglycoside 2''-phosphotransferase
MDQRGLQSYLERIRAVYPDLAIRSAAPIEGSGQNNAILLVNGDTIFRFPLYPPGAGRLAPLVSLLHLVGRSVTLPVPDPIYLAVDDPMPGRAFVGYPRIPGEPLWRDTFDILPSESVRQSLADQIATFLQQLHAVPLDDVLPDAVRTFDALSEWSDLYRRIRQKLFDAMRPDACTAVRHHFETFLADPQNRSIRPALIHGDFGSSNILFDPASNRLTGVVDFDSTRIGDPAIDLAAASCYGLDRLARSYPEVSDVIRRVQFYVGTFALQEALFGAENGDNDAFECGIATFR